MGEEPQLIRLGNRSILPFIIVITLACLLSSVASASADSFSGTINTYMTTGDSWVWSDLDAGVDVTFYVPTGTLNSSTTLSCTDLGGSFTFTSVTSGALYVSATTGSGTTVTMNGITFSAPQSFTAGASYTVSWTYGSSPTPPPVTPSPSTSSGVLNLPTLNTGWLWVYLYSGDIFGFFQAYLVGAFYLADLVAGVICMLFLVPLYIKTKSLLLLCIIWILLGGFFIVAFPIVSGLAVLFMALGIAGLLYRLFKGDH